MEIQFQTGDEVAAGVSGAASLLKDVFNVVEKGAI